MKIPFQAPLFALSLSALALVVVAAGCAGTATRESTGEYVDNAAITAKIKAEFAKDEIVKVLDVNVDTFKGAVQLSGFVDTAQQKSRAENLARSVPGVTSVTNNITVKGNSTSP